MATSPSWVLDSAGDIMSIAIKDDTIYGIGTDRRLYKQTLSAMSTSSSRALASAGDVQVTSFAIEDGTIYGIGNDKKIYKQTLSARSTALS